MDLEIIPLGQMWPDPNNPRKDFGDLDAMAATFEGNVVRPFEPVNPPVVVPDGEIEGRVAYRIVDGERRWRAMTKAGAVQACACVVCSMDEAHAMAAMVATDDKAPLTEAELSRGVQQMLAVGVAPEAVDKAARLKRGTARRVAKVAGAGTEQASIDQLLAAEEFEDEADRRALLAAAPDRWREKAADIRKRIRIDIDVRAMRDECARLGVPLVEEEPEGEEFSYLGACMSADDLPSMWRAAPEGTVGVIDRAKFDWEWTRVVLYMPADDSEPPFAAQAREFDESIARARQAREEFLASLLLEEEGVLVAMPLLDTARQWECRLGAVWNYSIDQWARRHFDDPSAFVNEGSIIEAYLCMDVSNPVRMRQEDGRVVVGYSDETVERWVALGEVLEKCGWDPTPDELQVRSEIRSALGRRKEEEVVR